MTSYTEVGDQSDLRLRFADNSPRIVLPLRQYPWQYQQAVVQNVLRYTRKTSGSLLRQIVFCLGQFRPLCVGVAAQGHELSVIDAGLFQVPGTLRSFRSTVESAIPIARRLQRGFILFQGQARLIGLDQQVPE